MPPSIEKIITLIAALFIAVSTYFIGECNGKKTDFPSFEGISSPEPTENEAKKNDTFWTDTKGTPEKKENSGGTCK